MLRWLTGLRAPGKQQIAGWIQQGLEFHSQGRLDDAIASYGQVLASVPAHFDALFLQGLSLQAAGRHEEALVRFDEASAADPDNGDAPFAAATSHRAMGRIDLALASYGRAATARPDDVDVLNDYGTALMEAGRAQEAVPLLQRSAAREPSRWDLQFNLANAYRTSGQHASARDAYARALTIRPEDGRTWNNLGVSLHEEGEFGGAIDCFRKALAAAPDDVDGENNLGSALQGAGRPEDALSHFARALQLAPEHAFAPRNIAQSLQELGRYEEALSAYQDALRRTPSDALRVRAATVLPVVPDSGGQILEARERFAREIETLRQAGIRIDRPEREIASCSFHLAYHGKNDRPLLEALSSLYLSACPDLAWTSPSLHPRGAAADRIKVGFVSRFLYSHSIGKTSRGLIEQLDRNRFEVIAIHVPPPRDDAMGRAIRAAADRNVDLPYDLAGARAAIAALDLDVLFFQEIGMDAFTYFLAFARLAAVQCVSFGHPDTTGIPNMDWWVSAENFEPEDCADHYSEGLWQARDVGTLAYYHWPKSAGEFRSRSELGLPEERALYFCPHSVFRLHPDFDAILAALLDADPACEILLLEGTQPCWLDRYLSRLERAAGAGMARVRRLPLQPHERFLNLMHVSDAILDPICFNGMNNSLDAFAAGVPVVTLPGEFQRGRHTAGMYRRMGWPGCVAASPEDYVRIAMELGRREDFAKAARSEISSRSHVLFEDRQVVQEFERFFQESVSAASTARNASGRT